MEEHSHHGKSDGAYVIAASFVLAAIILSASVIYAFNNVNSSLQQISSGVAEIKTSVSNLKLSQPSAAQLQQASPTPQPPSPPQPSGKVSLAGAISKGSPDAKIVLVEYSDFQCPYCERHYTQTQGQIEKNYVETGKIRFVYKHFPLSFHPNARPAAQAFECARDQGDGFAWKLHDLMFANQQALSMANYKKWAKEIGLDSAKFDSCVDSGAAKDAVIDAQMAEGSGLGVSGTPGFIICDSQGNKIGEVGGAQPYSAFQAALDRALASA